MCPDWREPSVIRRAVIIVLTAAGLAVGALAAISVAGPVHFDLGRDRQRWTYLLLTGGDVVFSWRDSDAPPVIGGRGPAGANRALHTWALEIEFISVADLLRAQTRALSDIQAPQESIRECELMLRGFRRQTGARMAGMIGTPLALAFSSPPSRGGVLRAPLWLLAGLLLAHPSIALLRGPLRRRWRRRCNACTGCGYDLTGNVSGVCPECGRKV